MSAPATCLSLVLFFSFCHPLLLLPNPLAISAPRRADIVSGLNVDRDRLRFKSGSPRYTFSFFFLLLLFRWL